MGLRIDPIYCSDNSSNWCTVYEDNSILGWQIFNSHILFLLPFPTYSWRGNVFRLIWWDLFLFVAIYTTLSLVYHLVLNEDARTMFEFVCRHCNEHMDRIPLAFVLGFYVSIVVERWMAQFEALPWPDSLALRVNCCFSESSERARLVRLNVMRYVNLAYSLKMRDISSRVKKQFPTLKDFRDKGMMTDDELEILSTLQGQSKSPYFQVLLWANALIMEEANRVVEAGGDACIKFDAQRLLRAIDEIREKLATLSEYNYVNVPLAYTQVTTMAVYGYFGMSLLGLQFLDPEKKYDHYEVDMFFPVVGFLRIIYFMGLLNVSNIIVDGIFNNPPSLQDVDILTDLKKFKFPKKFNPPGAPTDGGDSGRRAKSARRRRKDADADLKKSGK